MYGSIYINVKLRKKVRVANCLCFTTYHNSMDLVATRSMSRWYEKRQVKFKAMLNKKIRIFHLLYWRLKGPSKGNMGYPIESSQATRWYPTSNNYVCSGQKIDGTTKDSNTQSFYCKTMKRYNYNLKASTTPNANIVDQKAFLIPMLLQLQRYQINGMLDSVKSTKKT